VLLFDVTDDSALATARGIISAFPAIAVVALGLPEVLDQVIACADVASSAMSLATRAWPSCATSSNGAVRREVGL
jgi:hypothetical protein